MAQIIDTLAEPLLTLAGEQVIIADTATTATYPANGVTNQSIYTVELWSPQGQQIADLSPLLLSRHFKATRNRAEVVDLSFDLGQIESYCASLGLSVQQLLGPGYNEIRIRRGSRYLVGAQIQYLLPSLEGDKRTLEVRAVGFLELLKDRYLYPSDGASLTQTGVDIGQVAWNFINLTQNRTNGSFGFTLGTIQVSRTITDTWQPYATTIKDILIALTQRNNSIDFSFSADKVFNVYYPQGQDKTELRFALPGNIKSLRLPVDASELATLVIARGSGNGADQQVVQTYPASGTPEQVTYKLREVIDDYPSINVNQTLIDKATEHYRKNATPTVIPEIVLDGNQEPFLGAYWLGDRVPISIDANQGSAFATLDGQMWRVNEVDVTVDENDAETIRLKVGLY
jgi:hypothetical protein